MLLPTISNGSVTSHRPRFHTAGWNLSIFLAIFQVWEVPDHPLRPTSLWFCHYTGREQIKWITQTGPSFVNPARCRSLTAHKPMQQRKRGRSQQRDQKRSSDREPFSSCWWNIMKAHSLLSAEQTSCLLDCKSAGVRGRGWSGCKAGCRPWSNSPKLSLV